MESISALLANYKVITTNVKGKTTEEKVDKARVIFFGVFHDRDEESCGKLVNRLFSPGDRLLTEHNSVKGDPFDFSKQVRETAKSWELNSAKAKLIELTKRAQGLVQNMIALPFCYRYYLLDRGEFTTQYQTELDGLYPVVYKELLEDLKPYAVQESSWEKLGAVAALDQLLPLLVQVIDKLRSEISQTSDQVFSDRNASIVKRVLECGNKGKVFVTGGYLHFSYLEPKHFGAVDLLYKGLKSVPYVTLKKRKRNTPSKREKAGLLHSKRAAVQKLISKYTQHQKWIEEINSNIQPGLSQCSSLGEKFKLLQSWIEAYKIQEDLDKPGISPELYVLETLPLARAVMVALKGLRPSVTNKL